MPAAVRERPPERGRLGRPASAALAAGLISFGIYLYTLAPTVLADDSPELVSAAHVLGICHPTGYPLYLLLAKLFDLLPFATPPIRIGLFSAVCAAAAAGAIAWAAAKLADSAPAGLLAGLVAALNGAVWTNAAQPEVYALNALIIALAIAVFVRWTVTGKPREVVWLALLAGLGLAHHRTALFFTAPLLLTAAIAQRPRRLLMAKAAIAALAPLLFYLYLPIRSAAHPAVMRSDLTQWEAVVPYLMARDYYAVHAFARPLPEAIALAVTAARDLAAQLTYGGLALAAVGLVALWRRRRLVVVPLMVGVVLLSLWNLSYSALDIMEFFAPCALAVGLWAGVGLAAVVEAVQRSLGRRARWAGPALAAAALALIPANLVQRNWEMGSHRGEWVDYDRTQAMLSQIEPDGILMTTVAGDYFISMYMQVVEGVRRDITLASPYGVFPGTISDPRIEEALTSLIERYGEEAQALEGDEWSQYAFRLALACGDAVAWGRPVYCRTAFSQAPTELPAQALWSDFFRVTDGRPRLLVACPHTAPLIEFPEGAFLVGASVSPAQPRPGDLVRVTLDWRCAEPIENPPFVALRLRPEGQTGQPSAKTLTDYSAWLAYGLAPLPPTPEGFAYRQQVVCVVPTNAAPGAWALWVGYPEVEGVARLKQVARLLVVGQQQ